MRDEQRYEMERAFDLLPHVVGSSWAIIWFRLKGITHPTRDEYRKKVIEYFEMIEPLIKTFQNEENLEEILEYMKRRKKSEIKKIANGLNQDVEKRYQRFVDTG